MSGQLFFTFTEQETNRAERPTAPPPIPRVIQEAQVDPLRVAHIKHELRLGNSRSATLAATVLANRLASSAHDLTSLVKAREVPLPDPSLMKNFDRAVNAINAAISSGETIGIVGDYDVDGITSVAQFSTTLTKAGAKHVWRIPKREIDGYGISHRIANDLIGAGCKTVVLFDHGTNSHREIDVLRAAGIRVVVFDHHLVGESLPQAIVVNPAQDGCGFSQHKPCASFMAFLLCYRLSELLHIAPPNPGLAALATIADMVPLVGANRTITSIGLESLRRGSVRGVNYLAVRHGIEIAALSSADVAFYVAPTINAQGRLGDPDRAVNLLIADREDDLHPLSSALMRENELRKEIQASQLASALEQLDHAERPRVFVAYADSFHPGVVGLTAQGLALRYGQPSFAFARASDGTLRGSARAGADTYDLDAIIREARRRDTEEVILKAGGHKAAAGVTIKGGELQAFTSLIVSATKDLYPLPPDTLTVVADSCLDFTALTAKLVQNLNVQLEPYGQGFEAPRLLFRNCLIKDVHELSGGRRLLFIEQSGKTHRAFLGAEQWSAEIRTGANCDIVATPATFFSRNRHLIQLGIHAVTVTAQGHSGKSPQATPQSTQTTATPRLAILADRSESNFERSSQRSMPRPSDLQRSSRAEKLKLITDYLYPDLEEFEEDPFEPRELPDLERAREEFISHYALSALRPNAFQFRPPQMEFCRFFLDSSENVMLQAPTGTGKTDMALISASQTCSRGHRVIFAAPTIEISRQTANRAARILSAQPVVLDGSIGPKKRDVIYRDGDPQFISALPHVLRNDIERGVFTLRATDLLIIDEGHHTSGEYPYVPLLHAANEVGCRILFLSATPGQIEPGRSWAKLDQLKSLLKVETIFPLRSLPVNLHVGSRHLNLNTDILGAIEILGRRLRSLRDETLRYLRNSGDEKLLKEATRVLGTNTLTFASGNQLDSLITGIRHMNQDGERWNTVKNLHGIGELSELYQWLAYQGVSGFLLRVLEKRFECVFPTKTARSSSGRVDLAAPRYLRELYSSREIRQAYNSLARGSFVGLWGAASLENAAGLSLRHWGALPDKQRRSLFNERVEATLRRLAEELVRLDYEDHPKESFLFEQILNEHPGEQSIVYTRDRSHALFLAARLNHRFAPGTGKAVALTGLGSATHKGVSRAARRENLEDFLSGKAKVLVSTTAGNEGIDFKGLRHGYVVRGTASLIDALQQWGRLRGGGDFTYLCSGVEEHGKFISILRKEELFYRRMAEERQALLEKFKGRRS